MKTHSKNSLDYERNPAITGGVCALEFDENAFKILRRGKGEHWLGYLRRIISLKPPGGS